MLGREGSITWLFKGLLLMRTLGKAYSIVNFVMVEAYWNIGKRISLKRNSGQGVVGLS